MKNWKDDNSNLADVLYKLKIGTTLEASCCDNPDVHFYVHRFNADSPRGSAWVWCSNCNKYVHLDGFLLDADIPNCEKIDPLKLCAIPDYLEENKSFIDYHNKSVVRYNSLYPW